MQQRLVDAQQSMERDYLRLRHTEARYRLLFEAVDEAVLVLDAASLIVFEHNAAAARVLGDSAKRIVGRSFAELLAVESQAESYAKFSQARSAGRSEDMLVRLANGSTELKLSATVFKQDSTTSLLVRLSPANAAGAGPDRQPRGRGPVAAERRQRDARCLRADRHAGPHPQRQSGLQRHAATGRWRIGARPVAGPLAGPLVGGPERADRQPAPARRAAPVPDHAAQRLWRARRGRVSAVAVPDGPQACLGFSIRDVARRLPAEGRSNRQLPRSAEQLTGLVGRLPLKDIVGETTDLIERLCIEAALELTRDNRASAAEMLGLSRQSLYVKLRRYGIQDMGPAGSD